VIHTEPQTLDDLSRSAILLDFIHGKSGDKVLAEKEAPWAICDVDEIHGRSWKPSTTFSLFASIYRIYRIYCLLNL
jgi:hypothetical protein